MMRLSTPPSREVGTVMKDERRKLRSTFCYLLAEKFGKLGMFGG